VLGVVDDALAGAREEGDRVADQREVLLGADPDDLLQVQPPRLADDGADRREAVGEDPQRGIVLGGDVTAAGHAEGDDLGVLGLLLLEQCEELELFRVGRREAGLDEVDAELVELAHDAHLLGGGERHALALHAVAQGGVVGLDLRGHEVFCPSG
jgi:hypothetical protein